MCLAVPALLVECEDEEAIADLHGNRVPVSTALVPDAIRGDWVLIHAGFAIQKLTEADARQTWNVLQDLQRNEEMPQ